MASLQQERPPPPAYESHDPEILVLPAVPKHDLPTFSPPQNLSLPDLKSLGLPESNARTQYSRKPQHWHTPSNGPLSFHGHHPQHAHMGGPVLNASGAPFPAMAGSWESDGMASSEGTVRASSVMSLDDPETREAAETLSGLRNLDFHRSPQARASTIPRQPSSFVDQKFPPPQPEQKSVEMEDGEPEPILQLITSSHPWIGGTISGSLNAYNSTMNYSPAFIRSSAAFLERNIGSPVANGIGNVSRRTGVEDTVRRYLGECKNSESERQLSKDRTKRRCVREGLPDAKDLEKGSLKDSTLNSAHYRSRAASQTSFAESLPAYDENRAPTYEEKPPAHGQLATVRRPSTDYNWRTRIMITTSGLGVALSDSSLRSLKYCLSLLHRATDHLATIMHSLRTMIDEYERAYAPPQGSPQQQTMSTTPYALTASQEAASAAIADKIKAYGNEILDTLRNVVTVVSRYAGSALPANAGALVRRQLLSVPQRWRVATAEVERSEGSSGGDISPTATAPRRSAAVRMGEKWLEFARQGCDMITQVSLVVGGTVDSAEKWLEFGGKRSGRRSVAAQGGVKVEGDVKDVEMEDEREGVVQNAMSQNMWGEKSYL